MSFTSDKQRRRCLLRLKDFCGIPLPSRRPRAIATALFLRHDKWRQMAGPRILSESPRSLLARSLQCAVIDDPARIRRDVNQPVTSRQLRKNPVVEPSCAGSFQTEDFCAIRTSLAEGKDAKHNYPIS